MQDDVIQELLDKTKKLLGIANDDTTKDVILIYILEMLLQKVCDDCNLEEVPRAFCGLVCQLAITEYRVQKYGSEEPSNEVKSMSVGDVSWGYKTTSETIAESMKALGITDTYNRKVRQYRKVRW